MTEENLENKTKKNSEKREKTGKGTKRPYHRKTTKTVKEKENTDIH